MPLTPLGKERHSAAFDWQHGASIYIFFAKKKNILVGQTSDLYVVVGWLSNILAIIIR